MKTEQQAATFYELVGVPPNASTADIKAAYRARIIECHPDRNPSPDANEITVLLNEAWHVLGDRERRRLYDADLAFADTRRTQQSSPESPGKSSSASEAPPRTPAPESSRWEPRKSTGESSERTPWTCSGCGRSVPRYVDQCRCGQVRPSPVQSKRSWWSTTSDSGYFSRVGVALLFVIRGFHTTKGGSEMAAPESRDLLWLIKGLHPSTQALVLFVIVVSFGGKPPSWVLPALVVWMVVSHWKLAKPNWRMPQITISEPAKSWATTALLFGVLAGGRACYANTHPPPPHLPSTQPHPIPQAAAEVAAGIAARDQAWRDQPWGPAPAPSHGSPWGSRIFHLQQEACEAELRESLGKDARDVEETCARRFR